MKINRCSFCFEEFLANYKTNVCGECESPKIFGFPTLKETVSLHTMQNVSKARIKDMDRVVMLPDKVKDKEYVNGRRESNGKISDRQVDLTP